MHLFINLLKNELSVWFKKPSTYLLWILLMALGFQDIYEPNGFGGASGSIAQNTPIVIYSLLTRYSLWLTFLVVTFTANAVNRDHQLGIDKFYYALPLPRGAYLFSRFFGALLALFFISSGLFLGSLACNVWHFNQAYLSGSFQFVTYIKGYVLIILPNLFVFSAFSFTLVSLFRSIIPAYVVVLLSFMGFMLSLEYLDAGIWAAILDPFGTIYKHQTTYLWSVDEQNLLEIPITLSLWLNRFLWMSLGLMSLVTLYLKFEFKYHLAKSKKQKISKSEKVYEKPVPKIKFSLYLQIKHTLKLGRFDFKQLFKSKIGVLVLLSIIFLAILAFTNHGGRQFPTTYHLINSTNNVARIFIYFVLAFITSEIYHKRISDRVSDIFDTFPIPNWGYSMGNLTTLFFLNTLFVVTFFFIIISVQLISGYLVFDIGTSLTYLFGIILPDYFLFAILCLFFQVLCKNKYLGILAVGLFMFTSKMVKDSGFRSPMLHYGNTPTPKFSELNGFAHFMEGHLWHLVFWFSIAFLLIYIGNILWKRGRIERSFRKMGSYKFYGLLLLSVSVGSYTYYQSNILDSFPSETKSNLVKANYEKEFKKYENATLPEITDIYLNVDLFSSEQKVQIDGYYMLINKTEMAIDSLHITLDSEIEIEQISLNGKMVSPILERKKLHRFIYPIQPKLLVGDSLKFNFKLHKKRKGFGSTMTDIVSNGTLLTRPDLAPSIVAYSTLAEISDNVIRKKFGLPKKESIYPKLMPNQESEKNRSWNINFEAILSTNLGQKAITKGQLIKTWQKENRSYFHYKSKHKGSKEFSVFSGNYISKNKTLKLDSLHSVDLSIYHHKTHGYNIETMMAAMKSAVTYYSKNFGAYTDQNLSIIEVPGYINGARSFPQTIAFYENSGFLDNVKAGDKNFPYFIVAHETAHQWFGSQKLVRQQVKGANMVNETLAQYAAMMVIKKELGTEVLNQWLDYNLEEYLKAAANDANEVSLAEVENNQGYIYYHKGALTMYTLQKYMGEENLNAAIAKCIKERKGYLTNSNQLISYFREFAADSVQNKITELFEKVIKL